MKHRENLTLLVAWTINNLNLLHPTKYPPISNLQLSHYLHKMPLGVLLTAADGVLRRQDANMTIFNLLNEEDLAKDAYRESIQRAASTRLYNLLTWLHANDGSTYNLGFMDVREVVLWVGQTLGLHGSERYISQVNESKWEVFENSTHQALGLDLTFLLDELLRRKLHKTHIGGGCVAMKQLGFVREDVYSLFVEYYVSCMIHDIHKWAGEFVAESDHNHAEELLETYKSAKLI